MLRHLLGLLLVALTALHTVAGEPNRAARNRAGSFRQDRILVKPKAGADIGGLHVSLGCVPLWSSAAMQNLQVVKLPAGAVPSDVIAKYMSSGQVQYAEPDYEARITADPNDPQYLNNTQWALHNTGAGGGLAGADIHAPEAWNVRTSAADVIVALVDTGIRYTHEDLAANMWINPGEIAANGVDDDGDGIIDDVFGVNTINDSGDVRDDFGHGTHVAGIIGAVGNNGKGVCGVAWRVKLMSCKAFDDSGSGSISSIVKAIDYARAHGAQIINNSYGVNSPIEAPLLALKDAITTTRNAGILFVVAAGNESIDNDVPANSPSFPASFDADNIISVASTDRADALSSFSNFGLYSVDLAAPGEDVTSTYYSSDTAYVSMSGTSMSTPFVSGALALLRAQFPAENYLQLMNRLYAGTDPLPGLEGRCRTGGRLNVFKALTTATSAPANDNFVSAIAINRTPFRVSGINVSASKEAGEPNHAQTAGGTSVWWSWIAPTSGKVRLSTSGSSFSTLVAVYTGSSVTQLTEVASGATDTLPVLVNSGTTYYIAVDGVGAATGSIVLSLAFPPVNDDFGAATEISSFDTQSGSNENASKEPGEPLHAGNFGGKSLWWKWTPAASTHIAISTLDSSFDTVLAVYTGTTFADLVEVASNNDEDSFYSISTSRVEFDAVAGTTYYIAVDGFDGASGDVRLHLLPVDGTVRVFATMPWASETGPKNGEFTVTRTGSTAQDLLVKYDVSSNSDALPDIDYQRLPGTVTIPAGSASVKIVVVPIDNTVFDATRDVALQLLSSPDYALSSNQSATVHILDNEVFTLQSPLQATPSPAFARSEVTFSIQSNGSNVIFFWDYGDGTTDTTAEGTKALHTYASPGLYTVTATALFQGGPFGFQTPNLTETLQLEIKPPLTMTVSKLDLRMNFTHSDRISIKGRVQLPKEFVSLSTKVRLDIGGLPAPEDSFASGADSTDPSAPDTDAVSAVFVLSKNGMGVGAGSSFRLLRADGGGLVDFLFTMSQASFHDALDDEGLVNATVLGKSVQIPVAISIGSSTYYQEVKVLYTARSGKGSAKGPIK
ncbi:MAG TPA: S8 family serine peptidase [Planctomycetota bacterium]|jgi:subtilisin family serine protease